MIELEEVAPAIDLTALVERLRLAGFRIDTRQYLTAHELLLAVAAAGKQLDDDPEKLITHLGPIFCTSAQEQDLFADELRRWVLPDSPLAPPPALPRPLAPPVRRTGEWIWRHWRAGAALILVIAAATGVRWYFQNVTTVRVQGSIVLELPNRSVEPYRAEVEWDGVPVSVDSAGRFTVAATREQLRTYGTRLRLGVVTELPSAKAETRLVGQTLQVIIRSASAPIAPAAAARLIRVPLPAERSETRVTPWTAVTLGALAFAALAWGLSWLIDRARRTLAIQRLPGQADPEQVTLRAPEVPVLPVAEVHLRRAAIALRRRRDESLVELDVASTIDATVRAAGFFVPRYSIRRATPEYLALVSRRGENDHQARTFDTILDHLAELGVVIDRYSFHDDPRFVSSDVSGRFSRLSDVVSKHHRATLLVCAESAAGFNRMAGQMAGWIDATRPLVRRIYLTPESPYRWTRFEFDLLEAGFIVLPATDSGWIALADLIMGGRLATFASPPYARPFPPVLGTNESRWLDRNEPPPEIVRKLMAQVKGFLGPDGFSWLCACAVYPEVTWPLTLRVAHASPDYSLLPSLARLPWFRHGFMPDWLRRVLVGLLPKDDESQLRATLARLLGELSPQVTGRRSIWAILLARWSNPRDLLTAAAPGSPLRDHVFVGFMFGARRDPLWLRAPQLLTRVFRGGVGHLPRNEVSAPTRSFRERLVAHVKWWLVFRPASVRLALATLLGVVAFVALRPVMTQAQVTTEQESLSFVEIAGGEFVMGSDSRVDPAAAGNEQPQHLLYVPTFLIAATEVTVAQYSVCVSEGACSPDDRRALAGEAALPVRYLSWNEALEYCRWLEEGLKKWDGIPDLITGVLSGRIEGRPWHVTLPSEPEWEKAARGTDARIYPWGNRLETVRATRQQAVSVQLPLPAGSDRSAASPYGVLDMGGNVGEWTRSLARMYPYSTADGRESLDNLQGSQGARVIRGGSLEDSNNGDARTARRITSQTNQRDPLVGFRVAISSLDSVTPSAADLTLASARPAPSSTNPKPSTPPPANPPQKKPTAPQIAAVTPKSVGAAGPQAALPGTTGGSAKPVGPTETSAPKTTASAATSPTAVQVPKDSRPVPPVAAPSAGRTPDYGSVLEVLRRLEDAYARLDVNEVARIWPSRAAQFKTQRSALNGMRLDVVQSQVSIDGDTAIVRCELRWKYDWKRANQAGESSTANVELTLRRAAGSWVIVKP